MKSEISLDTGRAECASHAMFSILCLNAPAVCVLMCLSGLCQEECVSGNVFVEYVSCLYAAEFVWLRTGVAYCVSCLLT